jgi:hypothetical protein
VIAFVIGFVLYAVLAKAGLEPEVVPLSAGVESAAAGPAADESAAEGTGD